MSRFRRRCFPTGAGAPGSSPHSSPPLVAGTVLATGGIVAALIIGISDDQASPTGYTAGLPGFVALCIVVACGAQLIAYGDGAIAILHRKVSRAVWQRITTEVIVAGTLVALIAVPFATPTSRAGWLLDLSPVVGAYLVAVGYLVVRPRHGQVSGQTQASIIEG